MKNFKYLKIWEKGFDIAVLSYDLIKDFPKEEKFTFSSQITRSVISIPSNIAEGSSQSSERELNRYLEIALGSAFELETHILIAKATCNGKVEKINIMSSKLEEVQKMIVGFQNVLNKKASN